MEILESPTLVLPGQSPRLNAINLSLIVGRDCHGPFGELVYPALEVAFMLRATKQLKYVNGPRLMEHVMVTGGPGIGKSTLVRNFLTEACGAYVDSPPDRTPRPRFHDASSGDSWSRTIGSYGPDGRPIEPLLVDYDFFFISEMDEFLGSGPERKDKIMRINRVTEEGNLAVSLVKAFNADREQRREFAKEIRSPHVRYDPESGKITYQNRAAFLFATIPKETKEFIEWCRNGFISRLYQAEFLPSEEEAKTHAHNPFRNGDKRHLLELNLAIWAAKFDPIEMPPEAMLAKGRHWLVAECSSIANSSQVSFSDVFNARAHLTMMHGMTASAIARAFSWRPLDATGPVVVKYADVDLEFAKKYVSPWLNSQTMHSSDEGIMGRIGQVDSGAEVMAIAYIKQAIVGIPSDVDPKVHIKTDFINWCVKKNGLVIGTANNYLTALRKARCLKKGRNGSQTLEFEAPFLAKHGLPTESDDDARYEEPSDHDYDQ